MATVPRSVERRTPKKERRLPPLENGDHLDQKTFHERYEAMPRGTRAELIGGVVYMSSSPQKRQHGQKYGPLYRWLDEYEEANPSTEAQSNGTSIVGAESEPQHDSLLFILPE